MHQNLSYLKWWFKYRPSVFWFSIRDAFKYPKHSLRNLITFFSNDGVRHSDAWSPYSALSEKFLRMTKTFRQKVHGYPGIESDSNCDTYEHWQDTIKKIRLAHFWIWWQDNDPAWMIESSEDRKNVYLWLKKKYPFAAEFITPRFLKKWHTDVHLEWNLEIDWNEVEDLTVEGTYYHSDFKFVNKKTGEIFPCVNALDEPEGWGHKEIDQEMEQKYQEGMTLFHKYYRNLWD